jgi:hypothetical protein
MCLIKDEVTVHFILLLYELYERHGKWGAHFCPSTYPRDYTPQLLHGMK